MIARSRSFHVSPRPFDIGLDRAALVVRTIDRGWARACEKDDVLPGTREVELNELLRDGMGEEVKSRAGGPGPGMLVPPGMESRSRDAIIPDGHLDIAIYFLDYVREAYPDQRPHAIIECKRVSGADARLCRRYVGQGINRFAHSKYGFRHAAGFMVGYLESGDADLAVRGINRRLTRLDQDSERLGPGVAVKADWTRHSRHPRAGGEGHIDLHHVFLEFRASRS